MSTKTKPDAKKRTYKKRATKIKSTTALKKAVAVPVQKTIITIAPDGIITIEKTEETVTEQVMTKAEA